MLEGHLSNILTLYITVHDADRLVHSSAASQSLRSKKAARQPFKLSKTATSRRRKSSPQLKRSVSFGFHVREERKVLAFVAYRLGQINQVPLKRFGEQLVNSLCPGKRGRYPYNGPAPPFWPTEIDDYKHGPHRLQKICKIQVDFPLICIRFLTLA